MTGEAEEQLCQADVGKVEELTISKSPMKQLMDYAVILNLNVSELTIGKV